MMMRNPGASAQRKDYRTGTIMFARHQNCNMIDAAFNILLLIYHQTVYNLRQSERTPIVGLIMVMIRSLMLVGFFLLFYLILGYAHRRSGAISSCISLAGFSCT